MSSTIPQKLKGLETSKGLLTFEISASLKAANRDGMAWAFMIGLGENFISAFGIFLQATALQIALLTTLPLFIGALFQIVGVWALRLFKSRKSGILALSLVNALIWLPIAVLPLIFGFGSRTVWILLACVVVYHASANFTTPIWSSLIGDLVPSDKRGEYFGFRNKLIGFCTFAAVLLAGQILDFSRQHQLVAYGFLVIFILACLSRLVSAYYLKQYDDPEYECRHEHHFTFWQFIFRSPHSNFAKFVYFVSLINAAVNLSAPFFAVYMLSELHFSYLQFTAVAAVFTAAQFVTMQYWGAISDQFGNRRILNFCGFGVAVIPALWFFDYSFSYIIFIQIVGGFFWAGFNLAAANFIFDAVSPPKRARCVAYQAVVNGAFVLIGSVAGGLLVPHLPDSVGLAGFEWQPHSKLFLIFLLSAFLRLLAVLLLLPMFKEVRTVPRINNSELIFRITSIRPLSGLGFGLLPSGKKGKNPEV